MTKRLLLLSAVLLSTSCSYIQAKPDEGAATVQPDLTFSQIETDPVAVSDVIYLDKTEQANYGGYEGYVQSLSVKDDVYDALSNYFMKRFEGVGSGQVLEISLESMSERVRFEDDENYLFKVTDLNRKEHIDVDFTILMQLVYPHGGRGKGVRLAFQKKLVLEESASLNQREREYTRFTESLMRDVEAEVTSSVRQELGL